MRGSVFVDRGHGKQVSHPMLCRGKGSLIDLPGVHNSAPEKGVLKTSAHFAYDRSKTLQSWKKPFSRIKLEFFYINFILQ
jgi:hypothetical protein